MLYNCPSTEVIKRTHTTSASAIKFCLLITGKPVVGEFDRGNTSATSWHTSPHHGEICPSGGEAGLSVEAGLSAPPSYIQTLSLYCTFSHREVLGTCAWDLCLGVASHTNLVVQYAHREQLLSPERNFPRIPLARRTTSYQTADPRDSPRDGEFSRQSCT